MVMFSMHTLSTLIGAAFPYVLSKTLTEIICVVLFLGFGAFMVYEGLFSDGDDVNFTCKDNNVNYRVKMREKRLKKNSEIIQLA